MTVILQSHRSKLSRQYVEAERGAIAPDDFAVDRFELARQAAPWL